MATGNFYNKNAEYIYAIGMNYQDEDTQETVYPEYWEIEEEIAYIKERIEDTDLNVYDSNNREDVCIVELNDYYYGLDIEVRTSVVTRSGYYEGANIDWNDVNIIIDGWEFDIDNITLEHTELSAGLQAIALPYVQAKVESLVETLENTLNKVLKESTTAYGVSARFSNGETWYTKVA